MPFLNSRGEWCAGKGGKAASWQGPDGKGLALTQTDGSPWPAAGGPVWINDDHVVYYAQVDTDPQHWNLVLHNVRNSATAILAPHGANTLFAGGNVWASWTAGRGLESSTGFARPGAGLLGVGPDGSIAYKPDYHGTGPTIVHELDGAEWTLTEGHAAYLQLLGHLKAIWTEGTRLCQNFTPIVGTVKTAGIYRPYACQVQGEWWLVYWCEGEGLVAHPVTSWSGYRLRPAWHAAWHAAIAIGQNILVALSKTEGEGLGDVSAELLDLTRPRVDLRTGPPIAKPMVALLPRKLWIAPFFSHSSRYGDTALEQHVGNAIVVVAMDTPSTNTSLSSELTRVAPLGQPLIVQGDLGDVWSGYHDVIVAWWVSGATLDELGAKVAKAMRLPERPILAYLDNRGWSTSRPSWCTGRVWPSVQAYRGPGEPLSGFLTDMTRQLDTVQAYGQPMVLTPRFDDFNGTGSIAQTLEVMSDYDVWLRKYFMVGLMPFSDRRGNGISRSPELRAWAEAFRDANPARPNRYDYWTSAGSIAGAIRNKLMQTTETIVLLQDEKNYLLGLLPK